MRVLVACEESQRVCAAFRARGHEAYSCDLQFPSGYEPGWSILGDALAACRGGRIPTIDGVEHYIPEWDLIIAHPPCTYLSTVGNRMHSPRRNTPDRITRAALDTIDGAAFFMRFVLLDCPKVAIENPVGIMSSIYRKPDQIINPSDFVDSMEDPEYVRKGTCLWLKGLPLLKKTNDFPTPSNARNGKWGGKGKNIGWVESRHKGKERSKTFFSIAKAMAEQWG